jgi:hypothetical protein
MESVHLTLDISEYEDTGQRSRFEAIILKLLCSLVKAVVSAT